MRLKKKLTNQEIPRIKNILWRFFKNSFKKGYPDNPGTPQEFDYRKKLTTKEEKIIYEAKKKMPNLQKILKEAYESIQNEELRIFQSEYIKTHFSECVVKLEQKAFSIYLKYEEGLFLSIIEKWISENEDFLIKLNKKCSDFKEFTKEICRNFYPVVQRMEFESSQTRKARGGKSFEYIIECLLKAINIPCEKPRGREPRRILKRVDLVIPDQSTAINRPDQAFFLSCKRTLRERWKQAIPERKPSWRVFLLTIDENLPEDKANEIDALGMIVYVKDELKNQTHLKDKSWVRKLSDLPKDILGK